MPVWGAGMERNLFRYIWRNSWRDQSAILVVVAISYVFYFISLDLPKQIVNQAIQGEAFEGGRTTAPFMDFSIGPIEWLGLPQVTLFEGFQLGPQNEPAPFDDSIDCRPDVLRIVARLERKEVNLLHRAGGSTYWL